MTDEYIEMKHPARGGRIRIKPRLARAYERSGWAKIARAEAEKVSEPSVGDEQGAADEGRDEQEGAE